MSQRFLNGGLAEKARLANQLLVDVISACPDEYITQKQRGVLSMVCGVLHDVGASLRELDQDDPPDWRS